MISEIYTAIGQAFDNRNYKQVIKLVREALTNPKFGFNMNLLYKYAYSLIMTYKVKEAIRVLKVIAKNDTKVEMLYKIEFILGKLEKKQVIKLYIKDYLKKGNKLEAGLVVYLKKQEDIQSKYPNFENNIRYPFMIWKVEGDKIYAFPIRKYMNHGFYISSNKYLTEANLACNPNLVIFEADAISKVDMQIDRIDFNNIIKDLYERLCVLGTINNSPKNHFVAELEKSLSVSVGDIVTIYNISNHVRTYYYIIEKDNESSTYKAIAISHLNGEIFIKNEDIIEIPFSAYIMEKVVVSEENKEKIKEAVSYLEKEQRNCNGLILKRTLLDKLRHKISKFLDFFTKES